MAGLWRDRKGELFRPYAWKKKYDGFTAEPDCRVAAFNIITSLGLMVMEKQGVNKSYPNMA